MPSLDESEFFNRLVLFGVSQNSPNKRGMTPRERRNTKRRTAYRMYLLGKYAGRKRMCSAPFKIRKGRLKLLLILRLIDKKFSQPQCCYKPWISWNVSWAILRTLIDIALISGAPSNGSVKPQLLAYCFGCFTHSRIFGIQYSKGCQTQQADINDFIKVISPICSGA